MTKPTSTLIKGSNAPLAQEDVIEVTVEWSESPADLDISCFMVQADGKVPSDDYMIFYNQAADPKRLVRFEALGGRAAKFTIDLRGLQATAIEKCVFAATLDGPGTFAAVKGCRATARTPQSDVVYVIDDAKEETSLVLMELYRHQAWFKLRAIGRGFNGGLKPLAEFHGVTVEEETGAAETAAAAAQAAAAQAQPQSRRVPEMPPVPAASRGQAPVPAAAPVNLTKIDLLKKQVTISLEKKRIDQIKARVAIVIDASGSMTGLYNKGTVQRAFEKVLAVAACLDDNGVLDVWFFGNKPMRAPSVTEYQYEDYVKRTYPAPRLAGGLGIGNNEPAVMQDIIKKYTKEEPNAVMPTYILFFSDGGVYETKKISKLLIDCSRSNLFWQFIGLGRADFGVLRKLDELKGRFIDNAGFFALDDLDRVSDEELYDRMLSEFPDWIGKAKAAGLL